MGINNIDALNIAIRAVKQLPETKTNCLAISALENMKKKTGHKKWSKEIIKDTLYEWKKENGRAPTTVNLSEEGMPGAPIIKAHFHMSASLFLKQLFPELRGESGTRNNKYGYTCEQDWVSCFREQFIKNIDKVNSKNYDSLRDKNTPTYLTIMKHCSVSGWCELMNKAGVKYPNRVANAKNLTIKNVHSPAIKKLEQIYKQRELLNNEIKELYQNKR